MLITTPISLGELLDKISILIIKDKKITDIEKKQHIVKELTSLYEALDKLISRDKVKEYIENLISINTKLWNIEDDIRNCERKKQFDQIFIDLARSVYFTNDKRSEMKLKINQKFGSELVEVKSYKKY
tara:strand:+ start:82 stop:465 length:384 start_codon:yes stop_codon:yes gene_type:complete